MTLVTLGRWPCAAAQELWLELSRCAAMCYKRGGRRRNAALLRAEVADALAEAGAARDAVSLLSSLAQEVLLEGWLSLASVLLQRLLACCAPLPPVRMLWASLVPPALALRACQHHRQLSCPSPSTCFHSHVKQQRVLLWLVHLVSSDGW